MDTHKKPLTLAESGNKYTLTRRPGQVALKALLAGLLLFSGCARTAAPPQEKPALAASHALELARRWLAALSPEVSVTVENLAPDSADGSVKARLAVGGLRFRDTLTRMPVQYSGPAEAAFNLSAQGTWAMTRLTIDPGGKSTHTWDGLHITEDYRTDSRTAPRQDDIPKNEEKAIEGIRSLLTAETLYASTKNNQCGTIRDLVQSHLIEERYTIETEGYRFSVDVSQGTCGILATPKVFGLTGKRSFYAPVTDGQIRFSSDRSIPTATFPKLQ